MKKKNRKLRAAICIGVAVLILSMAVFANYDNANGYATIKNATKNMLFSDNYTMNIEASIDIDGVLIGEVEGQNYKIDKNGNPQLSMEDITASGFGGSAYHYSTVIQDGKRYVKSEYNGQVSMYEYDYYDNPLLYTPDDEVFGKGVNFIETLSDTLIGDIKNNIVLAQTDGDNRTYNLNMTGEQLPKYITAAFSFACAGARTGQSNYDENYIYELDPNDPGDLIDMIMTNPNEPYINTVTGSVTVDGHDRITAFDGKLVITGYDQDNNMRNFNFNIKLTAGDYGTTVIEPINPDDYVSYLSGTSHIVTVDDGVVSTHPYSNAE